MGLPQENTAYITPEAYLAAEMQSDTRSEYLKIEKSLSESEIGGWV